MHAIRYILLLLLLQSQSGFTQEPKPDSLFLQFKLDVETEQQENGGRMILDEDTKESYYLLVHYSSISNLLRYINDPNVHIRLAIFNGLLQKNTSKEVLEKIVAEHQTDTVTFEAIGADVVINWRMIDYMQAGLQARISKQLPKIDYEKELKHLKAASRYKPELEGFRHGIMEKDKLLKTAELLLKDSSYNILSFTFDTGAVKINSSDNRLSPEIKNIIEKTERGELVVFDRIKFMDKNKNIRLLPAIVIRLK